MTDWEHMARLEHADREKWQGMAEDLWEELQEWHADECSFARPSAPLSDCHCHDILAARWDELTHASDWDDDGDDGDAA